MPMLMWFPVIVMVGVYEALSDDMLKWQRACARVVDRSDA